MWWGSVHPAQLLAPLLISASSHDTHYSCSSQHSISALRKQLSSFPSRFQVIEYDSITSISLLQSCPPSLPLLSSYRGFLSLFLTIPIFLFLISLCTHSKYLTSFRFPLHGCPLLWKLRAMFVCWIYSALRRERLSLVPFLCITWFHLYPFLCICRRLVLNLSKRWPVQQVKC